MTGSHPQMQGTPTRSRGKTSVWSWFFVLLVAIGLLGVAVTWAGGVGEVGKMLGVSNLSLPSFSLPSFGGGAVGGSPGRAPALADRTPKSPLPRDAEARMFAEQVKSQARLADLVQGRISTMTFGAPSVAANVASIPVSVSYKDGSSIGGSFGFTKFKGTWYFTSVNSQQTSDSAGTVGFDSGVAATVAAQQAEPDTQAMIADDLLTGAYTKVTIDRVHAGPRTATVDFTVTERSDAPTKGRFVLISKSDADTTFWFVARFEKR